MLFIKERASFSPSPPHSDLDHYQHICVCNFLFISMRALNAGLPHVMLSLVLWSRIEILLIRLILIPFFSCNPLHFQLSPCLISFLW